VARPNDAKNIMAAMPAAQNPMRDDHHHALNIETPQIMPDINKISEFAL